MKPSVSEEHQFLKKCFSGDQHALENFVRRFSPLIYRTVHYTFKSKQVQFTHQDLEDHGGAGVPQVAVVINRHPAGIEAHFSGVQGLERFFAST